MLHDLRDAIRLIRGSPGCAAVAMTTIAATAMFAACDRRPRLNTMTFGGDGPPTLILLHGYGSSAEQWQPFTRTIALPPNGRFLFPQAEATILGADGRVAGRAWWPLQLASYRSGPDELPDLTHSRPAGLAIAAGEALPLIEDIDKSTGRPILLGGFSQGAMIAAEVAFRSGTPIDALILLSGTPVDERSWEPGFGSRRGLPVFIAHGRHDPVLSFELADRFGSSLEAAGVRVTWVPFDGGHEIPASVIVRLNRFLGQRHDSSISRGIGRRVPRQNGRRTAVGRSTLPKSEIRMTIWKVQ